MRVRPRDVKCLLLSEDEIVFHLRPDAFHVSAVAIEAAIVVAVLAALELALEIVVTRCAVLIAGGLAAMSDDFLHPPLFRVRTRINRLIAVAAHVIDARGDVVAL